MLVTTMCLWALNFTASKYILTHGVSPLAYAGPRYVIAAAVFALTGGDLSLTTGLLIPVDAGVAAAFLR